MDEEKIKLIKEFVDDNFQYHDDFTGRYLEHIVKGITKDQLINELVELIKEVNNHD